MIRKTALAAALVCATPLLADDAAPHVTVVTSGDAQTQLMSMVLTGQAMAKGHPTRVLLCGPGGDLALKEAPEAATAPQPPKGASPQGLLKMMLDNGATVEVCAIYLPGKGAGPEVLMDGVSVAAPPAMADALLAEDGTVWSF
ncbi:MAG: hypothetical protein CSA72_01625 [Rhodobacterales bacterium]|nr:MAG: hypothetical protein CSA72_01625 [Rhodobacterales bacterium]